MNELTALVVGVLIYAIAAWAASITDSAWSYVIGAAVWLALLLVVLIAF